MAEFGGGLGVSWPNNFDTDAVVEVNNPGAGRTKPRAQLWYDIFQFALAVEHELGLNPKGSAASVKDFLQLEHNTDGTHKDTLVAMLAGTQTITGAKTFSADTTIAKSAALLTINDTSGSAEGRLKLARSGTGRTLRDNGTEFQIVNAAFSATIVGIDNTGKMTAGIVPLARIGHVSTVTFTGVTTAESIITHNLGTDDVMIMLLGAAEAGISAVAFMARRPDGKLTILEVGDVGSYHAGAGIPASGTVQVTVNNPGAAANFSVDVVILRKS